MVWETTVQSQVETYQRLKKCYLIPPCLTFNIIRYISRIKCTNPGNGVAPSQTPLCSSYLKGSLWVALDYSFQVYFLLIFILLFILSLSLIYVYIYICTVFLNVFAIIIIILSCHQNGYPWPSLATSPFHSLLPAGPQSYTLYPLRAAVCGCELVALTLLGHVKVCLL